MIDLEENKKIEIELKNKIEELSNSLNIEELRKISRNLEEETLKDGFWNDTKASNSVLQKIKNNYRRIFIG